LLPFSVFAVVALTVGIVARTQVTPDGNAQGTYIELLFTSTIHMKAWLATAVALLACAQLFTAAWPVAYHCIFRLGFQGDDGRVVLHSLAGCVFYGAYVAKVLIVRMKRYPVWVIPTAGRLLFTALITIWYTSALWFFTTIDSGL